MSEEIITPWFGYALVKPLSNETSPEVGLPSGTNVARGKVISVGPGEDDDEVLVGRIVFFGAIRDEVFPVQLGEVHYQLVPFEKIIAVAGELPPAETDDE
jgi:hypothetical protein